MKLLTAPMAERIVLEAAKPARAVLIELSECYGQVLAENIYADRDQPSTDRSAMDGIAISFNNWQKGTHNFRIEGIQKAGIAQKKLTKNDGCFEIMTGAVIPTGCDCVIPVEMVNIIKGRAIIKADIKINRFQFIRKQGSEYKKGTLLLKEGTEVGPTHIAVAAAVGKDKVAVYSPKIAVIDTGDELVDVNRPIKLHQTRRSNAYALEALFHCHGFRAVTKFHLSDNILKLEANITWILANYDVIVLSGGVSMGKFDFVPQVLTKLNIKNLFHKVAQRPGRPLWFGVSQSGQTVFGLPGNPVSTIVCASRYVLPHLKKSCGFKNFTPLVKLAKSIKRNPRLTLFLPVSINTSREVRLVGYAGSGDYSALTESDGFVQIARGKGVLKKGTKVRFFKW